MLGLNDKIAVWRGVKRVDPRKESVKQPGAAPSTPQPQRVEGGVSNKATPTTVGDRNKKRKGKAV